MWWTVIAAWAGSPEYEQCGETAMTTANLTMCDVEETDRLEQRLPSLYARLASADAERLARLQKAHDTWLAYRDTRCAPPFDDERDLLSLVQQRAAGCRLEETQRRVDRLEGRGSTPEPEYQRCQQAGSQGLAACVAQAHQREDKRLNTVYGQVMASALPQGDKDWVKATERAWIPWRDATCAEEAAAQGGGSTATTRCALRMTIEQADWLALQMPR
jgi:uncharacterized protein YecT (DUF1311 family)